MTMSDKNNTQAISSAKRALILNKVKPQATAQRREGGKSTGREVKKP